MTSGYFRCQTMPQRKVVALNDEVKMTNLMIIIQLEVASIQSILRIPT